MRMLTSIAILLFALTPAEYAAAEADRAQFPAADQPYVYYLTTSHLSGEQQAACEAAAAFVVASSSRQSIVEKCVPVEVQDGLSRINLVDLKWDWRVWHKLLASYPYSRAPGSGAIPLVVRADWLVVQLSDTTGGTAYYELLYGSAKIDRDSFLKAWEANPDAAHHFGVIVKSKSAIGPAVSGIRLVENRPTGQRGSVWLTRDSAKITAESDPLEHLDGSFKHDAEELISTIPKVSISTGQRGALLAFLLSNAKGQRQEEAPAAIVTDHLGFRGQKAIRNFGSCIGCHATGFVDPGVSELRTYIKGNAAGVDIYATPKKLQEQIELFHLSDAGKQLARDNEDFQLGVKLINGLDGESNADAFRGTVEAYDREVDLDTAAAELHVAPKELRLALAHYNQQGGKVGARLAGLADGMALPRTRWEEIGGWYTAYVAVQAWEKSK